MKNIQSIQLIEGSNEELLPGFSPDFPYIASCALLDRYLEPATPWHWHRTVELFTWRAVRWNIPPLMASGCFLPVPVAL